MNRKPPEENSTIKMQFSTRLLGFFCEDLVAGAAQRKPSPLGFPHAVHRLLIGSTTVLVGMSPCGASLAVSLIMLTALSYLDTD